jgi:hypothetical protein
MAVLDYVLGEERSRLKRYQSHLEEDAAGLPKGSISIKIKSNHPYAYLTFREGGRVISKYIGPAESPAVSELSVKIGDRRRIVKELQAVKAELRRIERMLRV